MTHDVIPMIGGTLPLTQDQRREMSAVSTHAGAANTLADKIVRFVTRLKNRPRNNAKAAATDAYSFVEVGASLPPFHHLVAALSMRAKAWRSLFWIVTGVLSTVIVFQQRIIFHKLFQKTTEEVLIVPGAPEFFRVRPGQIPDASVFLFAEFVAENLGTFSYRNAGYHFGKIMEHMHPKAKGAFEAGLSEHLADWAERKVDQYFAYEPVKTFDLVSDDGGPKYVTAVHGTRTQYVEGHSFSENSDVLYLEFRTRANLTPDKPFIFEIVRLEWLTPSQYETLRGGRASVNKMGSGHAEGGARG